MLVVAVSLLVSVLAFLFHQLYWRRRGLPPGPFPLPLIGNAWHLSGVGRSMSLQTLMHQLSHTYPKVCTAWMGPICMVIVNDFELLNELFQRRVDVFTDRPRNVIQEAARDGRNGIIMTDGEKWKEQRRFALHVLRNCGFGRSTMEQPILDEVKQYIAQLSAESLKNNGIVDPYKAIQTCVGNAINLLIFGKRLPEEEIATVHAIKEKLDGVNQMCENPLFFVLTWKYGRYLPVLRSMWRQLCDFKDTSYKFLGAQIEELKKDFDPNVEPSDFTSAYLAEMHRRESEGRNMGFFSEVQLQAVVFDLWMAGVEPIAATLHWSLLYMLHHQDVQAKIHAELDSELGLEADVTYSDRNRLPYMLATINASRELQRRINIIPFSLYRSASETIRIAGYDIQPGTFVVPQTACVMWDERYFPDPMSFRPERFLESDGSLRKRVDTFLPFSIGKRSCLGEAHGRTELFTVFANTLQRFRIEPVPGEPLPLIEERKQISVQPHDYRCRLTARNK